MAIVPPDFMARLFAGKAARRLMTFPAMALVLGLLFPVQSATAEVVLAAAKVLTCHLDSPADGSTFNTGDTVDFTGSIHSGTKPYFISWDFGDGHGFTETSDSRGKNYTSTTSNSYTEANTYTVKVSATDSAGGACSASISITIQGGGTNLPPVAVDDSYQVNTGGTLNVSAPGILGNDSDPDGDPITAVQVSDVSFGALTLNSDGSFTYIPDPGYFGPDGFTYQAQDHVGALSNTATVTINVLETPPPPDIGLGNPQTDFKIMMNYELGMHCTGFEFAYCCVLPPYNSILAQVVKPQSSSGTFPRLLEGDPNVGKDFVGRETVLRDKALDGDNNFKKYVLKYWHDAQPRNDGRGKVQNSTLISDVELNSLLMWNTVYDVAATDGNNALVTGEYNGADGVVIGDGIIEPINDSYANGWLNHLYIYADLEGSNPANSTAEKDKIRLGLPNLNASTPLSLQLPVNSGPAFQPMGPDGNNGPTDNVLTFSGESGTVVFTQMKVLENLPIMLTSPRIWEALGLPLTPFEDTIDFYGDPGLVDEDSIRPYVAMKAQLHNANCDADGNCSAGSAVLDGSGNPVIGFGTAPIDIPNCERCHSAVDTPNSPHQSTLDPIYAMVEEEMSFWNAYYGIDTGAGDSDWYTRLKGAAISMLAIHDDQHGTSFTLNYPGCSIAGGDCGEFAQNTRLGHESVICQKCHADNVIAVVKSACADKLVDGKSCPPESLIPPVTEAIHWNHRSESEGGPILFSDSLGRNGGCQGCHPAHRSDGNMEGYPITLDGDNEYADSDNRVANGGCFVGRDVHSNPGRNTDGAETPSHLNAVGQWLVDNVTNDSGEERGIWCTNCHQQLSQEIWRTENCPDLINGDCITNPRGAANMQEVADIVAGGDIAKVLSWLDPKDNINGLTPDNTDHTHRIWDPDGVDANVATIEVRGGAPYGTTDADGDFSVRILDFCTTPDCVAAAQATLDAEGNGGQAVPVPFSAATDGRDHWLAAGEPHCADCHAAPYVEQSGNINPFPPFNYPRKASLMRYSRGHQDISCQGCHESIHGLYPVTPDIDTTTYAQAAALNHDGSHGPLKCGTCHDVDSNGIPTWVRDLTYKGQSIRGNFDAAVSWMHTYTEEASPLDSVCMNCHGVKGTNWDVISSTNKRWVQHSFRDRVSRDAMDKAELLTQGHVSGDPDVENPLATVCVQCHTDRSNKLACSNSKWKNHLIEGRVADVVWEHVSRTELGDTCGW